LRLKTITALVCAILATSVLPAPSAEPAIPDFWDVKERLPKPELSDLTRLRFLTTIDFPPFNFLDANGKLSGFHVDLVREICTELQIVDRCQIQAIPWNELEGALERGEGEAIIAGVAVSAETRSKMAFSRAYLRLPARFVMPKTSALSEPLYAKIGGKRIGVMSGSAHEAMLRDYFPDVRVVTYSRDTWLHGDLRDGKLDGVFGDGMKLSFWLAGSDSAGCCRFAGGPYLAPEYLGQGLSIATKPENIEFVEAFDYALREIHAKGIFQEIYLRYFPVSFF
jgi:polar amino acid transport system substrate-binding protein